MVAAKLISAFVFATPIVHFLFFLNPKFQASCHFLCLYSSVCVRPVGRPHCCFSHEAVQILHSEMLREQFANLLPRNFKVSSSIDLLHVFKFDAGGPRGRVDRSADISLPHLTIQSSHRCVWCGFKPCSGHVRQAKFCFRVCQVVFLGVLPFSLHLLIGPSHMS